MNIQTDTEINNRSSFAHMLFLLNITVLPVIAFIWLLINYSKIGEADNKTVIHHYRQSIIANVMSGILLVIVSAGIVFGGGLDSPYMWMWLILYFTSIHSLLILLAVFAYFRAKAGRPYSYPLVSKVWAS